MSPLTHDSSILIIGAGTWGCSTALQLARRGYQYVTVLDAHDVPSPISAGNDVNKIMEEATSSPADSNEEYVWNRMHEIATKHWKADSVFRPFYHATGFIYAGSSEEGGEEVSSYLRSLEGKYRTRLLSSPDEFRKTMPDGVLTGDFPDWKGLLREDGAGWLFARGALLSTFEEARRLGVKFITGQTSGKVQSLTCAESAMLGAQTADGKRHLADHVILCAGANSDLLFDFEQQLRPTAWTLAHIQMTEEERKLWKDLPVIFNVERGFFIEPDAESGELKLCDEHPGYCNFVKQAGKERSIPFAKQQIPLEAEQRVRRLLRECVPQIAERPFSFARICWDADTPDRQFLIDRHPRMQNLLVAVGGSGMGFMMMPAVGVMIADELEGVMDSRMKQGFRWRPETAVHRDWRDTQGRFGADGKVIDLQDVKKWTHIGGRSAML